MICKCEPEEHNPHCPAHGNCACCMSERLTVGSSYRLALSRIKLHSEDGIRLLAVCEGLTAENRSVLLGVLTLIHERADEALERGTLMGN